MRHRDGEADALERVAFLQLGAGGDGGLELGSEFAVERRHLARDAPQAGRAVTVNAILALPAQGVRSSAIRLPRTVHNQGKGGFAGPLGPIFATDQPASSEHTRRTLNWTPTHPSLLDDLELVERSQ